MDEAQSLEIHIKGQEEHHGYCRTRRRQCCPRASSTAAANALGRMTARTASSPRTSRSCAQAGYLDMPMPTEFGGLGMSLAEVCQEQRRLAYRAPATALAINMHLYWTGVAADLYRAGRRVAATGCCRRPRAARSSPPATARVGQRPAGAAVHRQAERVEGGYRFTGRKMFGSLTPVWTRLGIHAMDTSDPEHPKVVHAFMPRDTEGTRSRRPGTRWACGPPAATTRC